MKLTPVIRKGALTPFKSFFDEFENILNEENYQKNQIALDIIENLNSYEIHADLPGFTKKDINIETENNQLVIQAKKDEKDKQKEKNYLRKERRSIYYKRILSLGSEVDTQKINAKLEDGVLTILLPKKEKSLPSKINID